MPCLVGVYNRGGSLQKTVAYVRFTVGVFVRSPGKHIGENVYPKFSAFISGAFVHIGFARLDGGPIVSQHPWTGRHLLKHLA